MFNPNTTKSLPHSFPTHIVSIPALFFIPEKDFVFNKEIAFSSETPVIRSGTNVLVLQYGVGKDAKWARIALENGSIGFVIYKDSIQPLASRGIPNFYGVSTKSDYQANSAATEIDWRTQTPNIPYDDVVNGTITVHVELEDVVEFTGGKDVLLQHLEAARIKGLRQILNHVGYKNYENKVVDFLYNSFLFVTAEEWHIDVRPCSTLRVAVAVPKRFLYSGMDIILPQEAAQLEQNNTNLPADLATAFTNPSSSPENIINVSPQLDLKTCIIDNATRIRDLASIKTPAEINKWLAINQQYERNRAKIESDLFTRSLIDINNIKDEGVRILLGRDPLRGRTDKQKLEVVVSLSRTIDWAKFLGLAVQCLSRPIPLDELTSLMAKYKEARKFIDNALSSTLCNPYLKTGLKIVNGFELPVIRAYNPNAALARELEGVFVKIMHDLVSLGIKKSLEAAAKACATDPMANFNPNPSRLNPLNLEEANQDPAVTDIIDDIYASVSGPSPTEEEKDAIKEQLKNMIDDITTCTTYKEICSLYKGLTVNDEVYQLMISIVKRKYPQFVSLFATREQVTNFFKNIGNKLDLSLCDDLAEEGLPLFSKNGTNILCDDGSLRAAREKILADRGLTPELIDELLDSKKQEELKALEDVLKLLNSDNPFDFSQVPDLGCKVFPSGESIAPSMQSFTNMLNSMVRSIYDSFDAEAADWYKTTFSSVDPNKPKILKFNNTTGEVEIENNITISDNQKNSIKANSGKVSPDKQEADSKLPSGIDEIKYPSYIFKKTIDKANFVSRNVIEDKARLTFSLGINGDLQQKMDLDFIQNNLSQGIQLGEALLTDLIRKIWSQILGVYGAELIRIAGVAAVDASYNVSAERTFISLQPMLGFLYSIDTFLRSNVPDSEEFKQSLAPAYAVLGLDDTQHANGLFAAENGAAIYLTICEQLNQPQTRSFLLGLGVSANDIDRTLTQYEAVKSYYRAIIKLKINYPDFDVSRLYGIESLTTANGQIIPSYYDGSLYDIQRLEVLKNKRNYIKITEVTKVSETIQNFISRFFRSNVSNSWSERAKETVFSDYLKRKIEIFGFSEDGTVIDTPKNFGVAYEDLNQRIYTKIANSVLNKNNKFAHLKDLSSTYYTLSQESGNGQPYTQYLKLVLPQTPEQKLCGIRPHYLDIDSIKDGVIQEKANNICAEKVTDERTIGNTPISSKDMQEVETSSTQDAMLRGIYRLAVRLFLHDILLRGIILFGRYDPQTLRDEPMFISFMSKMTESEMRGMDNGFYNMLTDFLLKSANVVDNRDTKRSLLFRDFVEEELKYAVLPKLAKRIVADTNQALLKNKPKDNPIVLVNALEQLPSFNIFEVKNRAVYLLLNLDYDPNVISPKKEFKVSQKIFENVRATTDEQVLNEFIASDEYQFLFKYLLPVTQILNDFFVTSCLSTTTRKQVVNSFKGTKRDLITTAKIIQTNGQEIQRNPNNSQDVVDDPMQLIAGFLLQMAIKTPINVLKGIAESTEPNIALTSMAFKIARAFVPDLPSFIIPAVSVPLGTLPTPITCPLPFINPILSIAYFATLAWYDDKPPDELINNAISALERTVSKPKVICNNDVLNQDNFYQDKITRIGTEYDSSRDASTATVTELTAQQIEAIRLDQQRSSIIQKILLEINPDTSRITTLKATEIIGSVVTAIEDFNNIRLLSETSNPALMGYYATAVIESRTAIQNFINAQTNTQTQATPDPETEAPERPRGGNNP